MRSLHRTYFLAISCCLFTAPASADNAARPGKLIEETPTIRCLGVRWLIAGDDNHNAKVKLAYRKTGTKPWRDALDLFRVESAGMRKEVRPPEGEMLYAGSIFDLDEGTEYEVRLTLVDPDGGGAERLLKMKTWSEPQVPKDLRKIEVRPGELAKALQQSRPGDMLLLHGGVYRGIAKPRSGTPERPIAITSAGDGDAILDGQGGEKILDGAGLHDVMFERLTFRNATWGITVNDGARITVRRCRIEDVDYGFVGARDGNRQQHFFLADNTLVGRSKWPRSQGIEDRRGIQVSGSGHVVCYNRISGFGDGIDTFPGYPCTAIDFYRNEVSECTDDGVEMDFSDCNCRCFENRFTNVFQGISVQPVHGGPVYIFRNVLYNLERETFKMHNGPSGVLIFHNTSVKAGMPLELHTGDPVSNSIYRNNLFVGTTADYAYESTAPMRQCDFDYDGFAGQWKTFLKWNNVRYASMDEARQKAPVYRHAVPVNPAGLFATGITAPNDFKPQVSPDKVDLRLSARNDAIDAGVPLPNINDGFRGKAPDLGAYEQGTPLLHYGPR